MAGWSDQEFDEFVSARMAALVRFAYALTGDVGHAEDVVQTALTKTYMATRRQAPDDPDAYVRRAVVNTNLSRFRRRRVVEDLVDVIPDSSPPGDSAHPEPGSRLQDLVAHLSPRQRTVLVLRYQEDWPEAQIAFAMGVSVGTVKTLASRGLAALRASLPSTERTNS